MRITRGQTVTVPALAAAYSSDDQAVPAGTVGRVIKATKQFVTLVTDAQRELTVRADLVKAVS